MLAARVGLYGGYMIKRHPSLPCLCDSETGKVFFPLSEDVHPRRRWKPRWVSGYKSKYTKGYCVVRIEGKNYKVHRLIAETFIPPVQGKPQVDHINRIRDDNRVENLRWVDNGENVRNSSVYDIENLKYGLHQSDPGYWHRYHMHRKKDTQKCIQD